MADLQKVFQCTAAILLQKLLHVLAVPGGTPAFPKSQQRCITDGPQRREPGVFPCLHIAKFVLPCGKFQQRHIFVLQNPVHPVPSFPANIIAHFHFCRKAKTSICALYFGCAALPKNRWVSLVQKPLKQVQTGGSKNAANTPWFHVFPLHFC